MTDLKSLLARVETAEGRDDNLALDILDVLKVCYYSGPGNLLLAQNVTASIDAAVALVELVLPGWDWSVNNAPKPYCSLLSEEYRGDIFVEPYGSHGSTPPLAILSALLKALIAKEEGKHD